MCPYMPYFVILQDDFTCWGNSAATQCVKLQYVKSLCICISAILSVKCFEITIAPMINHAYGL